MAGEASPITQLRQNVLSRRQIEGLIADGRKIIIFDGQVLKVDSWMRFHPGGDKAILHMVGRDGTDEMRVLHSAEAHQRMRKFVIGRIEGRWTNFLPPIQGGIFRPYPSGREEEEEVVSQGHSSTTSTAPPSPVFDPVERDTNVRRRKQTDTVSVSSASSLSLSDTDLKTRPTFRNTRTEEDIAADLAKYPQLDAVTQDAIVQKYRTLEQRVRAEGLFECPYSAYAVETARYLTLFGLSLLSLYYGHYALAGLFLGLFWHQIAFTAHDCGHMGITHDFQIDSCIGIFVSDFMGGLSMGWWKRNHNVHHIVTNSPDHDPDIQHAPFFAVSHRFFDSLWSTYYDRIIDFDKAAQWAVKYQDYLYYLIMTLARLNLYRRSWEYLLLGLGPRKGPARWHWWLEMAGQVFFWTWFGYGIVYCSIPTAWDRFVFVVISHMATSPLHVQITLSHFAMSTADLGVHECFPQKMLRTTMDVDCPPWLDFIHGGLQFQVIHHLWPRMPRHNLRKAQKLVKEFCADVGIPYTIYGFVDGNKEVVSRLGDVAKQAKIFEECRKVCVQRGVFSDTH
jgi:delta8-fatty-acid desaturase